MSALWAIKKPDGEILWHTVSNKVVDAWWAAIKWLVVSRESLLLRGFSCVRVKIVEITEE